METLQIILNIAVMLVLLGLLFWMQKKHISFTKRVFTGLGLGILFGVALQLLFPSESAVIGKSTDWFNIVGRGYVGLLQMIVIPLIMVSIISAIMKLKGNKIWVKLAVLLSPYCSSRQRLPHQSVSSLPLASICRRWRFRQGIVKLPVGRRWSSV